MKKMLWGVFLGLWLLPVQAEAQFLKKLKERVTKTVEETATRKVEDQAREATSDQMDKMLEMKIGEDSPFVMSMEMVGLDQARQGYAFEWKYALQIISEDQQGDPPVMEMYMKPEATYWGAGVPDQPGILMVYDAEKGVTVMFMNQDGNKMANAMKFEPVTDIVESGEMQGQADYQIRPVEGKKILGHDCKGFEIEDKENLYRLYITYDTGLSFFDIYRNAKVFPSDFNPGWLGEDGKGGLMMEMEMKGKSNSADNFLMRCVSLEKTDISVNTAEYASMMKP